MQSTSMSNPPFHAGTLTKTRPGASFSVSLEKQRDNDPSRFYQWGKSTELAAAREIPLVIDPITFEIAYYASGCGTSAKASVQ